MKKSEAIAQLKDFLMELYTQGDTNYEDKAVCILDKIEEMGMEPPLHPFVEERKWDKEE